MIRIDIDPAEIGAGSRVDIGIVGDAKAVMQQLLAAAGSRINGGAFADWRGNLAAIEATKRPEAEQAMSTANVPIHPLRLCKEVRDFIDRDAILVVDGQEILNYGRQSIPTFNPRHRINSGTFGIMGVGMPFGVGAKTAFPDKQVVVLHGDGSFGLNAMELDTAARHKLPILVIISLNGGWTADPKHDKPGRDLGYTRFDLMAQALGLPRRTGRETGRYRPGAGARESGAQERQARAYQRGDGLCRSRGDDKIHQDCDLTGLRISGLLRLAR